MAGRYNITIDMGADFVLPLKYSIGGSPVNLTPATFAGGLVTDTGKVATIPFTFSVVDAAQGVFSASLTEDQTSALLATDSRYYVDVIISTDIKRIIQGGARLLLPGGDTNV